MTWAPSDYDTESDDEYTCPDCDSDQWYTCNKCCDRVCAEYCCEWKKDQYLPVVVLVV